MKITKYWLSRIFLTILILAGLAACAGKSLAQVGGIASGETAATNPKDRGVSVTASVASTTPPPTPILIDPQDGALLTSGVVVFRWRAVTGHSVGIDRYELSLNDQLKFGNISTSDEANNEYTLHFDGTDYFLTLRPDKYLPDGFYTWKIRVVDDVGLGTDSTTFEFTIDSTPPPLIITEIDGESYSISAGDPNSLPAEPVKVSRSRPVIKGKTQAFSEVELVVTRPNGTQATLETTASEFGDFTFTLNTLTANEVVTLKFTATDPAGNATVLDGLQIVYRPRVIVIPLPPPIPPIIIPVVPPELPPLPPIIRPIFPEPFPPLVVPEERPIPPVIPQITPSFAALSWIVLALALLLGYVLSLFWLTGSSLSFLISFLLALFRFWLWPFGSLPHEAREQDRQTLLPFFGFSLIWLDQQQRSHKRSIMTSANGTWDYPFKPDRMHHAQANHKRFEYPATSISVSDVRSADQVERTLSLAGESIWFFDARQGSVATTVTFFSIPIDLPHRFILWLRRRSPGAPSWTRFAPRIFLLLSLAAAAWLWWNVRSVMSLVLFIALIWIFLRDLFANLAGRMKVYVE